MKASFILAAIANIALVMAFPLEKDIIARRQVSAADIRSGTRRLSARQAGPSPGRQSTIVSEFINCPPFTSRGALSSETATRDVSDGGDLVTCNYGQDSCSFNGNSGALISSSAVGICPDQLERATSSLDPNAICFQGCPRQQNGLFFASSQLDVAVGDGQLQCNYSAEMFGPGNTFCQFNARDGSFIQGGACPTSLDRSAFCVVNTA